MVSGCRCLPRTQFRGVAVDCLFDGTGVDVFHGLFQGIFVIMDGDHAFDSMCVGEEGFL